MQKTTVSEPILSVKFKRSAIIHVMENKPSVEIQERLEIVATFLQNTDSFPPQQWLNCGQVFMMPPVRFTYFACCCSWDNYS